VLPRLVIAPDCAVGAADVASSKGPFDEKNRRSPRSKTR
jgi:hypothetical protein